MDKINGSCYKGMIDYGIRNLERHCSTVNDLNVFPVPDGDTGTNMVTTMKNGYCSIVDLPGELSDVAQKFGNAIVFGARGNSGVIVSQFFKGISEILRDVAEADTKTFTKALEKGVEHAHAAVATPVEGTILTVMREATESVKQNLPEHRNINDIITNFLAKARESLDHTPELLPILKKAGVVDSGGAGIVYFFEGIQKYLNGESIESISNTDAVKFVDYSVYNSGSEFEYGYCTELLIQLLDKKESFDIAQFKNELKNKGDSIVVTLEGDKVKLHIHTFTPETVLSYCHRFGEFLSMKIENMSVQHTETSKKYLCRENREDCNFAIVTVATDVTLQEMFSEMGADVVVLSKESPSSKEFMEAFEHTKAKDILVFPNSSNSILTAMQAGSLYKQANVTVLNSRSVAECYAALAIIDFENDDLNEIIADVNETISDLTTVYVVRATKNINYGNKTVTKNDFFALCGEEILVTGDKIENVVYITVKEILSEKDCNVITIFYGKHVSESRIQTIVEEISSKSLYTEIYVIPTEDEIYDLTISFE